MSRISRKKKECIGLFYPKEFFQHFSFISMYSVLMNKLSKYICRYTSKDINSYIYTFVAFLKNR